ncbi:MAG: hypothetical protein ACE15C_04275 [Phycisphaerae bacterium]
MALKLKSLMAAKPTEQLDARFSRLAGLATILLSILAIGGLVAVVLSRTQPMAAALAQSAYAVLFALAAVAGVNLLRGCLWSQLLLLMFWLANAILWIVLALAAMLWGAPAWWGSLTGAPIAAVVVPALALSTGAAVLLVMASSQASRSRYGTMVIVSVAVACALVLALNMIAHADPIHKDVESLGQYGLSKRTIRILDSVNEPIQMTVVYTSVEEGKKGADFRQPVLELAEEMRQEQAKHHKQFTVVNVLGDEERAQVKARLQEQTLEQAPAHKKLLDDFLAAAPGLLDKLKKDQEAWSTLGDESYAGVWGLSADVPDDLARASNAIDTQQENIRKQFAGGEVPDMGQMVRRLIEGQTQAPRQDGLKQISERLEKETAAIEKIAKVPEAVAANRADVLKAVNESHDAVKAMLAELGKADDPAPADPAAAITKFNAAARKAGDLLREAGAKLDEIAGKDNADLMEGCLIWRFRVAGPGGLPIRVTVGEFFSVFADNIASLGVRGTDALTRQAEYQKQFVLDSRKALATLSENLDERAKSIASAVDKLAKIGDEESRKLLIPPDGKKPLADISGQIKSFVDRAAKLPQVKAGAVGKDVGNDNIVLLEAGGKSQVVGFDDVWPLKREPWDTKPGSAESKKRVFNGDSAIASRILSLTQKPFGTIVLTYFEPEVPQQMMQYMRPPPQVIPKESISLLRKRLEDANFNVVDWNLTGEMPADSDETAATGPASAPSSGGKPKVLLVLPPPMKPPFYMGDRMPPQMTFGPAQLKKVTDQVNGGTPAIFLATWIPAQESMFGETPSDYAYNTLLKDWGIEAKTDYRLMALSPDETDPGKLRIDAVKSTFLPLSMFDDQPIGKPLGAQRMLWQSVCPVVELEKSKPKDVSISPVLTAHGVGNSIVASADIQSRLQKDATFEPDFTDPRLPDLRTPITVALAATRTGDGAEVKKDRIVVLGVGASFPDQFLGTTPIPFLKGDGKIGTIDPPRSNADLVINSAYWLLAQDRFIAAGPSQIKPVEMMSSTKLSVLWAICVLGLPAVVLVVGGVVFARRRS